MKNNEVICDEVCRDRNVIHDINADECKQWLNSRVTKSLISILDKYGILVALQFEEYEDQNNDAVLHTMIPLNIKQAMEQQQ